MPGVGEGWSEGGEGALTGAGRAASRRGCGGTLQWRGGRSVCMYLKKLWEWRVGEAKGGGGGGRGQVSTYEMLPPCSYNKQRIGPRCAAEYLSSG